MEYFVRLQAGALQTPQDEMLENGLLWASAA